MSRWLLYTILTVCRAYSALRFFVTIYQGPFVRIAPNLISFDDPVLLPQIYHLHANKTPFYSTGIAGEVPPLLQTVDDEEHAKKLKVLSSTVGFWRMSA